MALFRKSEDTGKSLVRRIGRRGSFLLFLFVLDTLFGWALWTAAAPRHGPHIDLLFPFKAWAVIWALVGVVCFFQAFVNLDRIAFSAAVTLKALWATALLYSWLFTKTDPGAWPSVVIWYSFAGATAIIANWPEHRPFSPSELSGGLHDS